jgi:hypothetical protein
MKKQHATWKNVWRIYWHHYWNVNKYTLLFLLICLLMGSGIAKYYHASLFAFLKQPKVCVILSILFSVIQIFIINLCVLRYITLPARYKGFTIRLDPE